MAAHGLVAPYGSGWGGGSVGGPSFYAPDSFSGSIPGISSGGSIPVVSLGSTGPNPSSGGTILDSLPTGLVSNTWANQDGVWRTVSLEPGPSSRPVATTQPETTSRPSLWERLKSTFLGSSKSAPPSQPDTSTVPGTATIGRSLTPDEIYHRSLQAQQQPPRYPPLQSQLHPPQHTDSSTVPRTQSRSVVGVPLESRVTDTGQPGITLTKEGDKVHFNMYTWAMDPTKTYTCDVGGETFVFTAQANSLGQHRINYHGGSAPVTTVPPGDAPTSAPTTLAQYVDAEARKFRYVDKAQNIVGPPSSMPSHLVDYKRSLLDETMTALSQTQPNLGPERSLAIASVHVDAYLTEAMRDGGISISNAQTAPTTDVLYMHNLAGNLPVQRFALDDEVRTDLNSWYRSILSDPWNTENAGEYQKLGELFATARNAILAKAKNSNIPAPTTVEGMNDLFRHSTLAAEHVLEGHRMPRDPSEMWRLHYSRAVEDGVKKLKSHQPSTGLFSGWWSG